MSDDQYDMLYCDYGGCRVNTFERGNTSECPACKWVGIPVPTKER